ncbi:hypothetical protein MJO29_013693 [Puccinia striiformis f. sp. tritici]|nr:hypothetical protein MJO29_013693 [Puccinia striiformis f. sp. tritici]
MSSVDRQQWIETMTAGFNSLVGFNIGELVDPPEQHVIGSMWRLKIKRDQFGKIIKYKAQWVAFGNHQVQGVDFDQTYASAHQQFNFNLKEKLAMLNFNNNFDGDSLDVKQEGTNFIFIHMHVDDGLVFSNSIEVVATFCEEFSKCYTLKWNENPTLHLGIRITRDQANNTITIDQEHYFNSSQYHHPYQQAIGCLTYAAISMRPDILCTVNYLARFSSCYDRTHWTAAKHLFQYIKGTIDQGIVYSQPISTITSYTDTDYDSCTVTRRSTTGHLIMWRGCLICWKSKQQQTVALSTTEAKYMAISDAA